MESGVLGCPICYQLLSEPRFLSCGHGFCLDCITLALDHKNDCPVCRDEQGDERLFKRVFVVDDAVEKIRSFTSERNLQLFKVNQENETLSEENDALRKEKNNLREKTLELFNLNREMKKKLSEYEKRLADNASEKRNRLRSMKTHLSKSIKQLKQFEDVLEECDEEEDDDDPVVPGKRSKIMPCCTGIKSDCDI
jgi:DNA repair exonuclease SbcCD ATPase subunit